MYGHIRFFEHFTKQYLLEFFKFANYMQLNETIVDLLFKRLGVKNEIELFNLLDLDLLVLTKGKKGAVFYFRKEGSKDKIIHISKKPKIIADASDTTGAGDAFFSSMVKQYAYTDLIDKKFIDNAFNLANETSRNILTQIGSRRKVN